MTPEAGQRFGPYEILGKLGGGGMGLVFRAWDERLHREVAVKMLHDSYKMPGMRERFLQEARAASALNHPNICTVFDIGEQGGDPYLVMELLEGETLKDRIARGALPVEEIVRYAEEITNALAVAHAKGIVHRDIKPANIFLVAMSNGRSQAKVLDFGLAKIGLEVRGGWESRTLDLTLAGATVGTLAYMSPEQARGEALDIRSDLFSLGVVMYEMATRQVPFRGATSALMFVQLFDHDPEPVRNWNESVPRELERVILKLLAKERTTRFQTTKELGDALTKIRVNPGRGWLHKGAVSTVPLVRANDPVARRRLQRQRSTRGDERGETSSAEVQAAPARISSADNMLIRPMRIPDEDVVSTERSVLHSLSAAGAGKESSAFERGAVDEKEQWSESMLAQARPGTAPFEYELELHGAATEEDEVLDTADQPRRSVRARLAVGAAFVVVAVAGFFLLMRSGLLKTMVLGPKDQLLLTVVDNKTADKTLDGTVMQGLEIALHQSKSLNVLGGEAYRAGLRMVQADGGGAGVAVSGQSVAQKVGARVYLYGEITGTGAPYTISVDVLKTDSNDKVASLQETASSRAEITEAIGRLAEDLRGEISDDGRADSRSTVSFGQDATANIDALHAYTVGEAAMQIGHIGDALTAFQTAVTLDPNFAQAQMRLSWLYREEKAELASSHTADLARIAAAHASDKVKMLAQFCYEMNAAGDYGKAVATIRAYVAKYPRDGNGMKGLAQVLRAQEYLPESLLAAQQGYGEDRFDAEMYEIAEKAMVGLDRYDSVLQLEAQANHDGIVTDESALAAAYLSGREDVVVKKAGEIEGAISGNSADNKPNVSYATLYNYGRYLDNTGRTKASLELWSASAAKAGKTPELSSTAASMLAEEALDRALTESCTVGLQLVDELRTMPKGPVASFNAGMAAALCGDKTYAMKVIAELQQEHPQNTTAMQYYVPELQAAADLGVNEPAKALQGFITVGPYDRSLLTPYLRGIARLALGQTALAIDDFQSVLARRGAAWVAGGTLYPMAQIELARTYAFGRDKSDSAEVYRQFLMLWGEADRSQPLIKEALARSK